MAASNMEIRMETDEYSEGINVDVEREDSRSVSHKKRKIGKSDNTFLTVLTSDKSNSKKKEDGEEMRQKALEKLGETSKRKREKGGDGKAKKTSKSSSDTIEYLREKIVDFLIQKHTVFCDPINCSQNAVAVEPIKFFNGLETSTVPVLENFKMRDNICSPYISYIQWKHEDHVSCLEGRLTNTT
ncbi:hypothetical protein pdam_00024399 [Pocillopora damicornis]|uniref:Uncharacterized protein n=1 Tax=Pocillopora damicornis TaxID=46731 RepID=A0A3M6UHX4_POCDA|nr:hypothetical protein pdam_00024399 [Pocillopora damicornis]